MLNWLRKAKAIDPEPEVWTPQMYLDHAKAQRMKADGELADAIDAENHFNARHPQAIDWDGRIVEQFVPEQRKPFAARVSQAHARLMAAIAHEDVMIQRYAPSKESRYIGGVKVA